MSKLIVDITELSNWGGKLTGVPRVMNELVSRFTSSGDAEFVAWDGSEKAYLLVRPPNTIYDASRSSKGSFKLKGKSLIKRYRIVHKAARFVARIFNMQVVSKNNSPSKAQNYLEITKGDMLIVLADWHGSDQSFVEHIKELKAKGIKLIQISYDLLPIVTPQYSGHATEYFTNYVNEVYPITDLLIAISENTKKDITEYLKRKNLKIPLITVMRLGDDFSHAKAATPKDTSFHEQIKKAEGFLLCVGTIEARKNHTLLYYTYKQAAQQGIGLPQIVIVGRRGWLSGDIYEIITNDPDTKDRFVLLQNASDNELSWLYESCLFTIYPSFYEGWGLPVAESISRGVPVISSNTSSLPEIAGDLIEYFSPSSVDECLKAIVRMLETGNLEEARVKIKQYKPASWDYTYEQVSHAIKELHE
jgi:glycosyltransferase involved in cell wall biosynthesis